jgi:hypothetical protein
MGFGALNAASRAILTKRISITFSRALPAAVMSRPI